MDAGDHLHGFAVAVAEAFAVEPPHFAAVARAVVADGDVVAVFREDAGHAARPEGFRADVLRAVAVQGEELGVGGVRRRVRVGNEFEQGFGVVGGDVRMGVGAAKGGGMRRGGEGGIGVAAQGFAFDAEVAVGEGEVLHGRSPWKWKGMI